MTSIGSAQKLSKAMILNNAIPWICKRPIFLFLELNQVLVLKEQTLIHVHFSSNYHNDQSKMNCISRIDDKDKNLFVQENGRKGQRWNLYTQIAIENNTLKCSKESYPLTSICNGTTFSQPCTLMDTNEVVDIAVGSIDTL